MPVEGDFDVALYSWLESIQFSELPCIQGLVGFVAAQIMDYNCIICSLLKIWQDGCKGRVFSNHHWKCSFPSELL